MQSFKFIILLLLLVAVAPLHAQQDLGIHFMDGVWQSNLTNPALLPDRTITISLPGFYNSLYSSGFTYNELVRTNEEGNPFLDVDNVIAQLDENDNIIRDQLDIPTIHLGIRIGDQFFMSAGHNFRVNAFFNYPKSLPSLVWDGNAQFIGETVEIGPDFLAQAYNEFYLGGAYAVNELLTVGARFKILSGTGDISVSNRELSLFTSEDIYQASLIADYVINSTGIFNYDGFDNSAFEFDDIVDLGTLFTENTGVAFDLGATIQVDDLTLTASILDIGQITWKSTTNNARLQGDFEYEGLDALRDALVDSLDIGSIADTLENVYEVRETNDTYSTALPLRFYLSGRYQLNDMFTVGGLLYAEQFREQFSPAFAINGQARFTNFLQAGLVYAIRNGQFDNIGINAALRAGPIQLVLATDNLLTVFRVADSKSANFRLGLNLSFGKRDVVRGRNRRPQFRAENFFDK